MEQLKEMGFPEELSREALRRTKNDSISAMDWLLENEKVKKRCIYTIENDNPVILVAAQKTKHRLPIFICLLYKTLKEALSVRPSVRP